MNNYNNLVIILITLFIFSGSYMSCSPQPSKDQEAINRINLIGGVLDAIENDPSSENFLMHPSTVIASSSNVYSDIIAKHTKVKLLIENADISLPLMFKRFKKIPTNSKSLILYFIVFEHTHNAESIPFIADYIASGVGEQIEAYSGTLDTYALLAAESITHSSKIIRNPYQSLSNQRKDIADKLRQWYAEYKKSNAQKD